MIKKFCAKIGRDVEKDVAICKMLPTFFWGAGGYFVE